MKRNIIVKLAALTAMLIGATAASADVYIQAPFVRVQVSGPGVHVRAPFVNLFVPLRQEVVVPEGQPVPDKIEKSEKLLEPPKKTPAKPPEPKPVKPVEPPPAPVEPQQVLTLDQFVKAFEPKAGNYEVMLLNPVTKQATTVRFTLPEGTPRRVHVSGRQIEFDYGARRYVRIQFDRDGAEIQSR